MAAKSPPQITALWGTAYVQGDWVASPVSGSPDAMIAHRYTDMLGLIGESGVRDIATWTSTATGVVNPDATKSKSADVVRNCTEIDMATMVITYLQRTDPPNKHWGSISLIGYAVGRGKPVILVAPHDCIVWKHHFVYHPLVTRIPVIDHMQALMLVNNALAGGTEPPQATPD